MCCVKTVGFIKSDNCNERNVFLESVYEHFLIVWQFDFFGVD